MRWNKKKVQREKKRKTKMFCSDALFQTLWQELRMASGSTDTLHRSLTKHKIIIFCLFNCLSFFAATQRGSRLYRSHGFSSGEDWREKIGPGLPDRYMSNKLLNWNKLNIFINLLWCLSKWLMSYYNDLARFIFTTNHMPSNIIQI